MTPESSFAGFGLTFGAQPYPVDVPVAVSKLDCYFTVVALRRHINRLGVDPEPPEAI